MEVELSHQTVWHILKKSLNIMIIAVGCSVTDTNKQHLANGIIRLPDIQGRRVGGATGAIARAPI